MNKKQNTEDKQIIDKKPENPREIFKNFTNLSRNIKKSYPSTTSNLFDNEELKKLYKDATLLEKKRTK